MHYVSRVRHPHRRYATPVEKEQACCEASTTGAPNHRSGPSSEITHKRLGSDAGGCAPKHPPTLFEPCNNQRLVHMRYWYLDITGEGGWVRFALGPKLMFHLPSDIRGLGQQNGAHVSPRTRTARPTAQAHPYADNP